MIVLSLFDGMSCGRVALERAGIPIAAYYASEIDKFAIQIAHKNYPDTIQLGSIEEWRTWDIPTPDLIMGGSPCQGFSFAGKGLGFDDPRSILFWEFVSILNHYKPKSYLLENTQMKKEHLETISDCLGVDPICINSALVSAQNRVRYYWCNWTNEQPKDKKISFPLKCGRVVGRRLNKEGKREDYNKAIPIKQRLEIRQDNKSNCLTTVQKDCVAVVLGAMGYRYLTPIECERLQTLPDNYTRDVPRTQRYKMISNGWTVDVIAHLLSSLKA